MQFNFVTMMKTYLVSLLLGIAPLSAATPAANFNASTEGLAQYGCDAECQAVFTAAQAKDRELFGAEFDFDFYATASNFSASDAGDLLKFEPTNPAGLNVIASVAAYRFQYTSKDLDGSFVPVTGFIAMPYTTLRKNGKYPLIAYAHGTIGVFRGYPPTTTQTLYDYTSWSLLIQRGYAIVVTDYAGLGNNHTQHKYLSFPAHANDLYYSVVAARRHSRASSPTSGRPSAIPRAVALYGNSLKASSLSSPAPREGTYEQLLWSLLARFTT
jgi:hypothetical protein